MDCVGTVTGEINNMNIKYLSRGRTPYHSSVCQLADTGEENLNVAVMKSLDEHKKYTEESAISCVDVIVKNFKEKVRMMNST